MLLSACLPDLVQWLYKSLIHKAVFFFPLPLKPPIPAHLPKETGLDPSAGILGPACRSFPDATSGSHCCSLAQSPFQPSRTACFCPGFPCGSSHSAALLPTPNSTFLNRLCSKAQVQCHLPKATLLASLPSGLTDSTVTPLRTMAVCSPVLARSSPTLRVYVLCTHHSPVQFHTRVGKGAAHSKSLISICSMELSS